MKSQASTDTAVCKPSISGLVILLVMPLIVGVFPFLLAADPHGPREADVAASSALVEAILTPFCLLVITVILWWFFRARIIADECGLRWRSLGGWKSAPWDGVRDYYLVSRNESRNFKFREVDTTGGKLRLSEFLSVPVSFLDAVCLRAQDAKARGWEILGLRAEDEWPRVCSRRIG